MRTTLPCLLLALAFVPLLLIPSSNASRLPLGPDTDEDFLDKTDCSLGNDNLLESEGSVPVCDESNSDNWFIYCGGKLLEARRSPLFNDT